MTAGPSVALLINTYEQPDYLSRVLRSVGAQFVPPDEVLLADDGSGEQTRRLFAEWANRQGFRSEHVWQEKAGFRRSRILNRAIACARCEYIVFLDGDSLPHPKFISDHKLLAGRGRFVQGHRSLVEQRAASFFGRGRFCSDRRRAIWQGQLRGLKHAFRWPLPLKRVRKDLRGVRGCNLAIWREDLLAVNGYNEAFVGWGREDSELALRLMNNGLVRLDVRGWALCYHLWHTPVSRADLSANDRLLAEAAAAQSRACALGLSQHLAP
jgi:glycosyltransferase involved in cell wall biosynthesis